MHNSCCRSKWTCWLLTSWSWFKSFGSTNLGIFRMQELVLHQSTKELLTRVMQHFIYSSLIGKTCVLSSPKECLSVLCVALTGVHGITYFWSRRKQGADSFGLRIPASLITDLFVSPGDTKTGKLGIAG